MTPPEIDLTGDLLPRHIEVFDTLAQFGLRFVPGRWVIVGGMMVMIIAREHHAKSARAEGTKDVDVVVDILTSPNMLSDVTGFLDSIGYELLDAIGDATSAARCSYTYHHAAIDVLCPDDTPAEQLMVPERNVASIAIPGGRRAFETARPVSLFYAEDRSNAEVFLPSLAGAIAVKAAAAVDERTKASPRHLQDVAFLLTIDADLDQIAAELTGADVDMLREVTGHFDDDRAQMWRFLDGAQRQFARTQFEFLAQ